MINDINFTWSERFLTHSHFREKQEALEDGNKTEPEKQLPLNFDDLRRIVESHFIVFEAYTELDGTPTFILPSAQDTKIPFQELLDDLSKYDLIAFLRSSEKVPQKYQIYTDYVPLEREESELIIKVFPNPEPKKTRSAVTNVLLLIATMLTISFTGILLVKNYNDFGILLNAFVGYTYTLYGDPLMLISILQGQIWNWYSNPSLLIIAFTASLLAIIGLHEMGHYVTAKMRGQKASLPFFIPGIPPIGTFGAAIIQRTPTVNRDTLFELGFMGPITGFIITLIVLIISIYLSPIIYPPIVYHLAAFETQIISKYGLDTFYLIYNYGYPSILLGGSIYLSSPLSNPSSNPLLYQTLSSLLRPTPSFSFMITHPLSWAAWIGMLVTALNLFPIGMLDAGHMLRSFLSRRYHTIASFIAAGAMIIISDAYLLMALIALFTIPRGGHPGPLDDVSPVPKWKIALFAGMIIIAIFTIPRLGYGFFF
ncbi:MAG: site-2 protease family protein [Candidatus Jordarchaeum sp.]|uniref:site-2 protease family protein n=1 Tax=Candidatus Jordarchaeum sp. TaxID=2823881 RepID=UPI0040490078